MLTLVRTQREGYVLQTVTTSTCLMDTHVYLMGTVIQEQHGSGNKPTGVGVGVGELIVIVENKITWVLTDFTQA